MRHIDLSCKCRANSNHFDIKYRASSRCRAQCSSISFLFQSRSILFRLNYMSHRRMSLNWHRWIPCNGDDCDRDVVYVRVSVLVASISTFIHCLSCRGRRHFTINEQMKSQFTKPGISDIDNNRRHFMLMITPSSTTTTTMWTTSAPAITMKWRTQSSKKIFRMKCDSGHLTKRHPIHRMNTEKKRQKTKTKHKNETSEKRQQATRWRKMDVIC